MHTLEAQLITSGATSVEVGGAVAAPSMVHTLPSPFGSKVLRSLTPQPAAASASPMAARTPAAPSPQSHPPAVRAFVPRRSARAPMLRM